MSNTHTRNVSFWRRRGWSIGGTSAMLLLAIPGSAMIAPAGTTLSDSDAFNESIAVLFALSSDREQRECDQIANLLPTPLTVPYSGKIPPYRNGSEPTPMMVRRLGGKTVHAAARWLASLPDLMTPIPGAIVTSPYGWRLHPILKKRRFHKGVDFGAPEGTPVRAAQDGIVEVAGWKGHYGYYLRIRHSRDLETAYAHLENFDPALKPGTSVKRGQRIASVGETGWATGPHLYYEVIVDGHRVNPLGLTMMHAGTVNPSAVVTQQHGGSGQTRATSCSRCGTM